ncbi:MAG TPA: DNA gyrase inhibitor YacG [Tepidisphaeraceae bacterium]|nr:DNA gyrase inhibitor YacG [Tepidisphaeraceae bacterium]
MKCPICKKDVPDPHPDQLGPGPSRYYPFCSERCKLIDLGRWLGGKYQIPVTDPDDDERDEGVGEPPSP